MNHQSLHPNEAFDTEGAPPHKPEYYEAGGKCYDERLPNLNVGSKEADPAAKLLSNFSHTPFTLDGQRYESTEAFIQSLKFPDPEDQKRVAALYGFEAKKAGKEARREVIDASTGEPTGYVVTYHDIQIPYKSPEHYGLIERAIRAKIEQNPQVKRALVGVWHSDRRKITHTLTRKDGTEIIEPPTTSLPAEVFTAILMKVRHEMQIEYWAEAARVGDIDFDLRRFFKGEWTINPDLLAVRRAGYRAEATAWLRSLTPKGMRYGTDTQDQRIAKARLYADKAGTDLITLAKEAGLTGENI